MLVRLGLQPLFLGAMALDLVSFAAAALALQRLPLFFVQSTVAASVGVTALIAVRLGSRIGPAGLVALGGLAIGLVLLALSAAPESVQPTSTLWRSILLLAVFPCAVLGALSARAAGRWSAAGLAVSGGLAFSVVALGARTLEIPQRWWHLLADPALAAVVAGGVLGTLLFAMALQRGAVTSMTALTFATDTVVPSVIGLALLSDATRPGHRYVAVAGFALAVGGSVAAAFATPIAPPDAAGHRSL
ncbi:MAG: hypothetical protein ACR2KJ_02445 [Jatrophihabitans sp.]